LPTPTARRSATSIYLQKFDYVAREPALLAYAQELIQYELGQYEQGQSDHEQPDSFSALVTLKTELARQYAKGADHNRGINKRRERRRSIAGLAALGSVLTTVFLVGTRPTRIIYRLMSNRRPAMTPPESPLPARQQDGHGLTRQGKTAGRPVPVPPPMQVVTKGWWVLRDEAKTVDELNRADNG
jgi:hypothetical protein